MPRFRVFYTYTVSAETVVEAESKDALASKLASLRDEECSDFLDPCSENIIDGYDYDTDGGIEEVPDAE